MQNTPRKQTKRYVLIHFWPTVDGFRKRMEMLVNVLQKKHVVERVETLRAFFGLLLINNSHTTIIIYISLLAPVIAILKLRWPRMPVYYMVRGDEVTYVRRAKRYFRAFVAIVFQRLLNRLGCHFIFVSEDLRQCFLRRLGKLRRTAILPNTPGEKVPDTKPFDGRVALVGDFNTVKNIEWAIENLSNGKFDTHLYGNKSLPEKWQRPWLHAHGVVQDLVACLRTSCSVVIFPDTSAGFPNVLIEALQAGCSAIVHREFPFKYLPVSEQWRFELNSNNHHDSNSKDKCESDLEAVLSRLLEERRNFKRDNKELIALVESDWEKRVWEIFS